MHPGRRDPRDFDEEVRAHLELETERLIAEGLAPDDARRAARRAFGSVTAARERFYESQRILWLDHLWQDVRSAVRNLRRYPAAGAIAIFSLAGGIGAATATLVVRDAVFRKPPPLYQRPHELSRVQIGSPDHPVQAIGNRVPGALFLEWRAASVGATLAALADGRVADVRTADQSDAIPVRLVTREFFSIVGVDAAIGRTLSDVPDEAGPPTCVVSYRVWQTLLGGRPDAVGSTIWIARQAHVVVGVMPERFWFASMDSPIWTRLDPRALAGDVDLEVIARRAPGLTHDGVARQLQPGLQDYAGRLPVADRQIYLYVSGIEGTPLGGSMAIFIPWLLGAAVLLTLLIACANVAILVIAQWTAREQEIAVRASLGASRARIVRALVTESIVMAVAGGALGVIATFALRGLIISRAGIGVVFFDLSIEPIVLVQTALIALGSGALAGIGPALLETRRLHGNPLRAMQSSDRVRQRWRHTLVVLETTVTVALLVVSTTMVNCYRRQFTFDLGFRTAPLATVRVEDPGGVAAAEILDVLARTPGVAAAAASTTIPYAAFSTRQRVGLDETGSGSILVEGGSVSPEFFAALGVPIRAGRAFTPQDAVGPRVAIVSETLARRFFPNRDPIGQRVWIRDRSYDIVGVAADYANSAFRSPERLSKVFLPLPVSRTSRTELPFLVRASGDPATLLETLRRTIQEGQPGALVSRAFTIDQSIAGGGREMFMATAPLVPLVATGLLLTAVGIYGVLAFAVTRRSKELALRLAIGATHNDLLRLVAAGSMRLVLFGTACGILATFALTQAGRAAGGGGSVIDPTWASFLTPVLIILSISALATWIPSRRARRLDPSVLLRTS